MTLDQLAQALDPKAKRAGNGSWSCCCPAHEDTHASLSLSVKDGRLLWRCHSGCSQADVQAALLQLGLLGKPNGSDHTAKPRTKADQSDDWRPIMPVPDDAAEPAFAHPAQGKPNMVWTYRDAGERVLFHVARFNPPRERKQIIPRCWGSWNGKLGWYWRHPAAPRPLYGLDQLAARPDDPVLVAEGEKSADAAAELLPDFVVITWPGGSSATGMADWSVLKEREVWIWPDHDEPGRKAAEQIGDALLGIAAGVRIVDPPADLPESWDLADEHPDDLDVRELIDHAERHADRLERLVEAAETDPGAPFEAEAIDFLAALRVRDQAGYERTRARLKKAGVRIGALDQEIEHRKPEMSGDGAGKGKALDLPEPEPWHEPVDGAALIADLVAQIRRFVILSDHAALGAALWVIHAHAHDCAFHSPRLTLTSPTMRCGKSTMLRTIGRLVPRPLPTANITPAALFRVIEAAKPTLLIDEADSFAQDNEELRSVVNSSHCCLDAYVIRAVAAGDDYEARRFSTWAPMAIASIGKVASTVADRSVLIGMERKAPGQTVARMRVDRDDGFGLLASKAARWIADHLVTVREADPETPPALNDRQTDNWRCLLAISDLAGGEWPAKARAAALALSAVDEDADTIGVQLLGDVKIVFDSTKAEAIWTEDLLRHLHAMELRPWPEYGRARKPITPRQLATLLKPFGVAARQVWKPEAKANKNGYASDQFVSAWERYLSSKGLEATESASFSVFPSSSEDQPLEGENPPKPAGTASSRPLGDREGEPGPYQRKRVGQCPVCHFDVFHDNCVRLDGVMLHNPCVAEWRHSSGRPQCEPIPDGDDLPF